MNLKATQNEANKLAFKMAFALVLGLMVGTGFIFLREHLIASQAEQTWNTINSILFQDITQEGAQNAVGIFYILGQLFINSLQLVIVPMVFTSIALAMCNISDTKKLGRISYKTILGFLTTSVLALIIAGVIGITAHNMGLFNVEISNMQAANTSTGSNPLVVLLQAIPNNISDVFSQNGRVLAIVFLAVATGLCINALGEQIRVLKTLLEELNKTKKYIFSEYLFFSHQLI